MMAADHARCPERRQGLWWSADDSVEKTVRVISRKTEPSREVSEQKHRYKGF